MNNIHSFSNPARESGRTMESRQGAWIEQDLNLFFEAGCAHGENTNMGFLINQFIGWSIPEVGSDGMHTKSGLPRCLIRRSN